MNSSVDGIREGARILSADDALVSGLRRMAGAGAIALAIIICSLSTAAHAAAGPAQVLKLAPALTGITTSSTVYTGNGNVNEPGTSSIAAGPNYVVEMTTDGITIYQLTRTATNVTANVVLAQESLATWFNTLSYGAATITGPHVIYDQYTGRWITIALQGLPGQGISNLLIGVCSSSNPSIRSAWQFSSSDMSTDNGYSAGYWDDFDQIGIDQNAVYVSANEWSVNFDPKTGIVSQNRFAQAKVRVFPKRLLYSSPLPAILTASMYTDFFGSQLTVSTGDQAFSLQPCHSYGSAPVEYLVSAVSPSSLFTSGILPSNSSSSVLVFQINASRSLPTIGYGKTVNTLSFSDPSSVLQQSPYGGSSRFVPGDSRLLSAVYRNGLIWTAGNTGAVVSGGAVCGIHWMRINPATGVAVDDRVYTGASGESFYLPAITVDRSGSTYLTYNRSSANAYPSVQAAIYVGSQQGTPLQIPVAGGIAPLASVNGPNGIALDPVGESSVWIAGAYPGSLYNSFFGSPGTFSTAVARAVLATAGYRSYVLSAASLTQSWGAGISGGQITGYGYGTLTKNRVHALRWAAVAAQPVDLTPTIAGQAQASGIAGTVIGGTINSTGYPHAAIWTGAMAGKDLNPRGFVDSLLTGVSGGQQVGYGYLAGRDFRALLWAGSSTGVIDLTPAAFARAYALGVSGGRQVGAAINRYGAVHPILWTGNSISYVDLLPPGYLGAYAMGISGGQQVGFGWQDPQAAVASGTAASQLGFIQASALTHALLWSGTAASAVDLTPLDPLDPTGDPLFDNSVAVAMAAGHEVGYGSGGRSDSLLHALVWSGSPYNVVDLHLALPPGYVSSWASGIDSSGNIVGTAVDANGRHVAVVWVPQSGS